MDVEPKPVFEVTTELGKWISGLELSRVPPDVVGHLKMCLLNSLGCGLFGAAQRWGVIAGDVAVAFSSGGVSSLFARPEKVSPADAALANGTAIHGFEIDDAHLASSLHPGAVTIPAGLAIAEAQSASGEEFLVALAAGYEVGIRVGICAGIAHATSGYHVTGTVGTLSAAAAAARLLRLPADRAAHALSIAATQAAGLYAARTGAMTKRFHAGRASQSGVIAAYFAERGFTGSPDVLEAPFGGFMSTLRGEWDPGTILEGLGDRWETARVGFKAYAACASAHTIIDGVRAMRDNGLTAANLERLTIHMSKKGQLNVGWPYRPGGVISAQMNGYYAAAIALIDGDAFIDQYKEDRLADPRILSLLPRIEIIHDPELDRGGAAKRHAVRIQAALKDAGILSASIEQRRGSVEYPLSATEVTRKFRRLAKPSRSEAELDELIETINRLEIQLGLRRLVQLITTGPSQ